MEKIDANKEKQITDKKKVNEKKTPPRVFFEC